MGGTLMLSSTGTYGEMFLIGDNLLEKESRHNIKMVK